MALNNSLIPGFKNTLKRFTRNSGIPGYKYLTGEFAFERYIWYVIHVITLVVTFFMVNFSWRKFMVSPTVTTLETFKYPLTNVPMPGISICNFNKISKMKAEEYAGILAANSGFPENEIFKNIVLLGRLYQNTLQYEYEMDNLIQFQHFLDEYNGEPGGNFNTYATLKRLLQPCSEVLRDCFWQGEKRNCDDLFVSESTMEGECCVFNYISAKSTKKISRVLEDNDNLPLTFGKGKGLRFQVVANISDYYSYKLPATRTAAKPRMLRDQHTGKMATMIINGNHLMFQMLISLPTDFPDTTSGGLTEEIIDFGLETVIQISTITTSTMREVKRYPIQKRGCIFNDEMETIFGSYSYSDCIMDCKIRSIVALCQCIPFNYVQAFQNNTYYQCTLADLLCLNRHASKWNTMYPTGYKGNILEREKQDSLLCTHCFPACSDTLYNVISERSDIIVNGTTIDNTSVVHINFQTPYGTYNKQDVLFYWYEIIGMFGGICSLTMGLTFISIFDVIYFFICILCKKLP